MTAQELVDGQIILIDKPYGWTSFDVVKKIRGKLQHQFHLKKLKVGHAGTLDPLATGLLIICTGKFTKHIDELQGLPKTYTGTLVLGATTPSFDLETEINQTFPTQHLTEKILKEATQQFLGEIDQKPPVFSAIKKEGKRLYEMARAGKEVEVESRKVWVYNFEIERILMPEIDFLVKCSKGTYIRSLAHDFGHAVDSGAHLKNLRRTHIGEYGVAQALTVEAFMKSIE